MKFIELLLLVCIAVSSVRIPSTTTTSSNVQASATVAATANGGGRNTPVPVTNATAIGSGATHARLLDIVEKYSLVMNMEVDAVLYRGLKTDTVAVLKEYRAQGSSRKKAIELLHAGIRGVFKLRGNVVKDALASGKLSRADRTTIIEYANWSLEIFKLVLSTLADAEYESRRGVHIGDVLNGSLAGKTALCLAVELKLLDVLQELIGAGACVCHCDIGKCIDGGGGMASSCLAVLLPAVLNADEAMFSLLIAKVELFFTLNSISGHPKLDEWLCSLFNELGDNSLSLFQIAYLQCVLVSVCTIYDYIIHTAGHNCSLNLKNSKVDLVLQLPYIHPQCHAIHQHPSLVIDLTSSNFHPPKGSHPPQRSYIYSTSRNGARKQWLPWWHIGVSDRTRASGWSLYSDFSVGRGRCDLPRVRVDELDGDAFRVHKYLHIPVVIEGATDGWGVWEEWRKENLRSHWSHLDLLLGTIPYAESFGEMSGYASIQETLDYIDSYAQQEALQYLSTGSTDNWEKIELPFYVFDSDVLGAHFSEHYSIPTYFSNWTVAAQIHQFILGPAGSGAPFHYHCPALNALIYGRKKWFLLPPGQAVYSKQHPLRWYSQHYPSLPDSSLIKIASYCIASSIHCTSNSSHPQSSFHRDLELAEILSAFK